MENETPPVDDGTMPLTDPMGNVIYSESQNTPVEPPKPVLGDPNITSDPLADVQTKMNEPAPWAERWGLTSDPDLSVSIDRENRGLPPSTFGEERRSQGFKPFLRAPTETDAQTLRENQNNPQAIAAYEHVFGPGTAQNVLRVPPMKDILRLISNGDNPEARAYFDKMYGYTSMYWIGLMAKDQDGVALATPAQRRMYAESLNRIYNGDRTLADRFETTGTAEVLRSIQSGVGRAVQELGQSAGIIKDDFVPNEALPQQHPVISGFLGGLAQFGTAQGVFNAILPGKELKGAAQVIRQITTGGLADAFGSDPNDPYALKSMGELFGLPPEITEKLPEPEWFESDAGKRALRTLEGGAMGLAVDGVIKVIRSLGASVYEFRTGNMARAEAAKAAAEAELERLSLYSDRIGPQRPQVQLELPLGDMNNPDAAAQVRLQRVDEANAGQPMPTEQPDLPMDLPFERRLDALPDFVTNRIPDETMSDMEARLMKAWGIDNQLTLDLPEPPTGPIAREGQGDLFGDIGLPNQVRPDPTMPPKATEKAAEAPPATSGTTAAPRVATAPVAAPTPRLQTIGDAIDGTTPAERQVRNIVDPPKVQAPNSVVDLLNSVDDFERAPFARVRAVIAPFIDDFIDIARRGADELENAVRYVIDPLERTKLKAILTTAMSRAQQEASELADTLSIAKSQAVTDSRQISDLQKRIKANNDLIQNLQLMNPLASESGYDLVLERLESKIARKNAASVAKLRASGMSDEAINRQMAHAFDRVKRDNLRASHKEFEEAKKTGNQKKITKAEKRLKDAIDKVEKELDKEAKNVMTKLVSSLVEVRAVGLTSSLGTLARSIVSGIGFRGLDRVFENVGLFLSGRLGKQFTKAEVLQVLKAQDEAKKIAINTAFSGQLDYLSKTFKMSAKDAFEENSTLRGSSSGDADAKALTSANWDVDPNSLLGKGIDYFGRGVRGLLLPMSISDELMGNLVKRAEVAKDAGYDFMANIADRKATAKAKLRDPKLSKAEAAALKAEVAELNDWRNAKVNGKTFNEFVEAQVKAKSDANGRIIDDKATERANYILMRSAPTGPLGRKAMEIANMGGGVGRLVQPFITAPMNTFKRWLETTPVARLPGFSALNDLKAELDSPDPRTHARAVGKFYVGWAITATSMMIAYNYFSTGSPSRDRNARLMQDASSAMQSLSIGNGKTAIDISGLEPMSTHVSWWANIFSTFRNKTAEYADEREAAGGQDLGTWDSVVEEKLPALFWAMVAANSGAIIDTGNMEGMKQIIDALNTARLASDNTDSAGKQMARFAQNYVSSTVVPAPFRMLSNAFDARRVDPNGFLQAIYSSMGFKDGVPLVRDFMGRPIESKTPFRSLAGPFVPQDLPEQNSIEQYVANQLYLRQLATGKTFQLPVYPPESVLRPLDLTKIKSVTGDRSVYDVYGDKLASIKLPAPGGRMQTLAQALKEVLDAGGKDYNLSMGFAGKPGSEADALAFIMNRYRKQAWLLTKGQEKNNVDLVNEVNKLIRIQAASQNKKNDAALPLVRGISQ